MKTERGKVNVKGFKFIGLLLAAVLITGCGVKKKAAQTVVEEKVVPTWHTCLIQGARIVVQTPDNRIAANATLQVVRDSLLVISVMPLFGIEMMRLEATPEEVTGFDKIQGQYASASYDALNRKLSPSLSWETLQQICAAELPTGSEKARLTYAYGDDLYELTITYPERQTDVPLRIAQLPKSRYTKIDISKWL